MFKKSKEKNTKRDFFGLDKEKPKILITCQDESEINNLNTSNVNNEFNNDEEIICDINKNSNNENKIKNELNLDNEINNNNKAKNKPKNENEELKNYETMEEEEKIEDEIEEDDDEEDEEEEEEEEEEENDDDDETLSELRSFDSLETLSKKENESTIFENRAEDLINTSSKQKKDYTIIKQNPQKNDVVDINKSQTNKSKTSSKPNEYIKIDTTLTQVYIYFCKKANISINDIYSQFIIDNLTKSQINEFLNRSIKKPCEPQYEHRIKNGFTIPISNQNEVIVNKGTSGFKKRLT
ncbi:hypothetical protein LY90DRAFT_501203 [Neocallimastix californiae]|uniref:Uncharacterized protein n=1 Tax=Neocallimastix californiae TaxID=1754190 RepID=A0A1Y2F3H6_9FUNG|nr:hypothetical protein LY90DRAFT_501203 [Neocallimastix californiae]|eukprot:ORY77886.1 hypothetical protein LY90DRAFT_501203 [Neocallimastix californiae]